MQEGVLSLMQMAKTSVVIAELQSAGVPFVSVLTNPRPAGYPASYAMQGDVILPSRSGDRVRRLGHQADDWTGPA